jgi:hypothetical protein
MAAFNPSWSDSVKYDGGSFGGGGNSFGSGWNPGSGGFSGIGTDSDTWNKGFNLKGDDPFGLNKDKKESPWGDVARFAGDKLSSYAQNRYGQGSGLAVGGGGGVSQSGDLTIVYPQSPTVIPGQKSGLGGALGTLAGIGASFIPGLGPGIAAAMPAIGGSIGGAFG